MSYVFSPFKITEYINIDTVSSLSVSVGYLDTRQVYYQCVYYQW